MKGMEGERKKKAPLGNTCSHLSKRAQWRRVGRYIIRKNKWFAYLLDVKDGGK